MMNSSSPLKPSYPTAVIEEPGEGGAPRWKWTVILPFIDAALITTAVSGIKPTFTAEETARNKWGVETAFSRTTGLSVDSGLSSLFAGCSLGSAAVHAGVNTQGVVGDFQSHMVHQSKYPSPNKNLKDIDSPAVSAAFYTLPPRGDYACPWLTPARLHATAPAPEASLDVKLMQKHQSTYKRKPFGNHHRDWMSREDSMVEQVEYYFGDKNYNKDGFLQAAAKEHPDGFIPLETIMSFAKMMTFKPTLDELAALLSTSAVVEISHDGQMIRKAL